MLTVDKKLLAKLPKYAQNWKWIQLQRSGNCIDALHEALDGDNRKEDDPLVEYTCDNFEEFIWYVRKYNKEFRRMN